MATQRFNGVKVNVDQLSPTDVIGLMEHTAGRLHQAGNEMARLTGLAMGMGLFPMENIVSIEQGREFFPEDPTLFDTVS